MPSRTSAAVLLAMLAGAAVAVVSIRAQLQAPPAPATPSTMNHNLVVLDPAHGGPDAGATLGDQLLEKNVTLAVAAKLRAALTAAGFTVVTTRDADPPAALSTDDRAEAANRAHAVACIVIHATGTGSGVHIYTSSLQPPAPADDTGADFSPAFVPTPWDMAQAASVRQSLQLAGDLRSTLAAASLPTSVGTASVRPLDNLMCPAVAVELAPLAVPGSDATAVSDAAYQQHVADALTAALVTWRTHAEPHATATTPATPAPDAASIQDQTRAAARAMAAAEAAGRAAERARAQIGAQAASRGTP
jgi:N-acetylmuramoyl-L-alanine amidase